MNRYPLWKNILLLVVLLVGLLFALPNIFDQDPSIQISAGRTTEVTEQTASKVREALESAGIQYKAVESGEERLLVRFNDSDSQLRANDVIAVALGGDYVQAMTLAPDIPGWLSALGGEPMYLGLDLRGGIHVLIDVDMETAERQALETYSDNIRTLLREKKLRYVKVDQSADAVEIRFREMEPRDKARNAIEREFPGLTTEAVDGVEDFSLVARMKPAKLQELRKSTISQNITTLRNRVDALGVSEPVIQQQGERRIVVQLPGAQDPTRLKDILSATATLEYRLEDTEHSVEDALAGKVPPGSKLYKTRKGEPILLKKQIIVKGEQITDASLGFDQRTGGPAVIVNLDSAGGGRMRRVTTDNVGKPMAVVFIETRTETRKVGGEIVKKKVLVEEVISVATIQEPFGKRFQTTGLDSQEEARNLALLLRAGALAAPIEIVEERTIGPALGADNIRQGFLSVMIGLALVVLFMLVYYRVFGLVANLALMANLVLVVALLSIIQATLTLPGIAGIVLTVGMAVDANVLIFERIREELRIGNTPQASIHSGYEKALSTIVDANITTFIAAIVLYTLGTGPIRGFAVTLALGIATSMFTAILGTRAVINLIYGGKRVDKLAI